MFPFMSNCLTIDNILVAFEIMHHIIATQFGSDCVQTISHLPGTRLRWTELFQMSCGRQI